MPTTTAAPAPATADHCGEFALEAGAADAAVPAQRVSSKFKASQQADSSVELFQKEVSSSWCAATDRLGDARLRGVPAAAAPRKRLAPDTRPRAAPLLHTTHMQRSTTLTT